MSKRYDTRLVKSLHERGFDLSYARPFERGATIRCSQCDASAINGVACHERGCLNIVPTCAECGSLDPERTCCQSTEDDYVSAAEQRIEDGLARWSETGTSRRS